MGVRGITGYLQRRGLHPATASCCSEEIWPPWSDDDTTKNGCSVQAIPSGSTVLVDGNGLAFHLMKVAYARHTRSVAKTTYCPEVGSLVEEDISKIIPLMLPMSEVRTVAKEFVTSTEGRGLFFRFCWGNPSQQIPYVEETSRRQRRLETWDAMRRFCNIGVFPLRPTDSSCRCLDTFPLPRLFLKVIRHSLSKAKLDIMDLDGDIDREISMLARSGDQSIFVLGCNSDYLFYKDIQYIPFQGLFVPRDAKAPLRGTVLTRKKVATGCDLSESKWVELSLILGNKFVDRNSLRIPSRLYRADHAVTWLLNKAEDFQVLSNSGTSAMVFARAMYNLEGLDAFVPIEDASQTTPEERTQMEIREFLGIPDVSLSKVKIESKVKHLVLENLHEYVNNPEFIDNEGLNILTEEHFSAYQESLKLDCLLSDISCRRPPRWVDIRAGYVIECCIWQILHENKESDTVHNVSISKLFRNVMFHYALIDARSPERSSWGKNAITFAPEKKSHRFN